MAGFFSDLSTTVLIGALLVSALVIGWAGTRMTGIADKIADRTGLGEAITGGVLLVICALFLDTTTSKEPTP